MERAYPEAEADRLYLEAHRQVGTASSAARIYLADLAEALGIAPIRWRALQRIAEQAVSDRAAGSAMP